MTTCTPVPPAHTFAASRKPQTSARALQPHHWIGTQGPAHQRATWTTALSAFSSPGDRAHAMLTPRPLPWGVLQTDDYPRRTRAATKTKPITRSPPVAATTTRNPPNNKPQTPITVPWIDERRTQRPQRPQPTPRPRVSRYRIQALHTSAATYRANTSLTPARRRSRLPVGRTITPAA